MVPSRRLFLAAFGLTLLAAPLAALETERQYLSGTGYGETRDWEFRIDTGRGAELGWTTIAVPSQWEQEGFGTYRYGRHDGEDGESARYRFRFAVPPEWRGRRVRLVFEGVMTDTEAWVNGRSAGPIHQGGFTRFDYDVTEAIDFDGENLLEVGVAEKSADASVEKAERQADYWVFGGIYRPVYLEATPMTAIRHVAIDARHRGEFRAEIEIEGDVGGTSVTARVRTTEGTEIGSELGASESSGESRLLEGWFPGVEAWSAERPRLHELEVTLSRGPEVLHRVRRRFGFRSFWVDPYNGLFVNGERVLLRGINRHSFWPDSGRTLNREINYRDAELLKELNANAVRASHYPPDEAFLDACDELGLYVIDELPGWHDAYRTEVGEKLVREMVRRDVNHPSVVLWANGNEGGWNEELDDDFRRLDPQRRYVFHPDDAFGGLETFHYPTYRQLERSLDPETLLTRLRNWLGRPRLVMPTEMLHGLYDGGLGAGLEDYWDLIRRSPRAGGGFLWGFLDEGIVRTDRDGEIDTFGNYAPDGLVGPYREKEASFRTVRRLWSPIQIEWRWIDKLLVENRFREIDLSECRFEWRLLALPPPGGGEIEVLAAGESAGPRVAPGASGALVFDYPPISADAVEVEAFGPDGRSIETWTLSRGSLDRNRWLPDLRLATRRRPNADAGTSVMGPVTLTGGGREVQFEDEGRLARLSVGEVEIELAGGPRPVLGDAAAPRRSHLAKGGGSSTYSAIWGDGRDYATWTLFDSGWLRVESARSTAGGAELEGVAFDLSEAFLESVDSIEWLGHGPDPVWANRLAGPRLGLWKRSLDENEPGRSARGFYDGVGWMRLIGREAVLTLVPEDERVFVGVSAPWFGAEPRDAVAEVPAARSLTLLRRISAMGSKFHTGTRLVRPDSAESGSRPVTLAVWLFWEPVAAPAPAADPAGAATR